MIFALGFYAYRLYSQSWQRDLSGFEQSFEHYKSIDLFNSALHGIIPYMVKPDQKEAFYFLGRAQGFTAVTLNALFNPAAPAVIRVFKENTADGNYQLVYEEASLQGIVLVDPDQNLPFVHRLVLMTELKNIEFSYFGWKNKQALFDSVNDEAGPDHGPRWFNEYDGLTALMHPSQLQIKIEGFELIIQVPQRSDLGNVIPEVVL